MTSPGKLNNDCLRIAFAHIPGENWSAGTYYLKNIFHALRSVSLDKRPEVILLVQENAERNEYNELASLVDTVLFKPAIRKRNFLSSLLYTFCKKVGIVYRNDNPVGRFLKLQGIDVFFTLDAPPDFCLPFISWIPDFQHLHYPDFFSDKEIRDRNAWFANSARYASLVVLSSKSARNDFISFAPWASKKARVLSFVAQISDDIFKVNSEAVCEKYFLPEKFILLPNQFWQHKNHQIVIEALKIALSEQPELTIVCTGNTNENRKLSYFSELLGLISESGARERMILLGLVPRTDLFCLMRQSVAVLQPSLFEGWNTTVEEVKSLGKKSIVSDIAVHREQDPPEAIYFDPTDAPVLSRILVDVYNNGLSGPDYSLEKNARNSLKSRTVHYGENFLLIAAECKNTKYRE